MNKKTFLDSVPLSFGKFYPAGPACQDPAILEAMLHAGMNIARLNFSHGTHEYHANLLKSIRTAVANYSKKHGINQPLAIAIDTKGSEIRTGLLEGVPSLPILVPILTFEILGNEQ